MSIPRHRPPGVLGPAVMAGKAVLLPLVRARRRSLGDTVFVAVTGSVGKTTTTGLLEAVLGTRGPVAPSGRGAPQATKLARTVLGTRSAHWACVYELQLSRPGVLDQLVWAYEPDVAVVTTIGLDHWRAFGSPDAIAAEKRKVVAGLRPDGLAVLNTDDPLTRGLADAAPGRVVHYGRSAGAGVRAEDVSVDSRGRLMFTLVNGTDRWPVATRLQGELWLTATLAALATGVSLGVPEEDAVRAIESVEPVLHRLSVLEAPGGVTYLRDDWKAPTATVGPALDALASMPARRRVAVLGELHDDRRRARVFYRGIVQEARRRADLVVLVGDKARYGLKGNRDDPAIVHFDGAPAATRFLRGELAEGDVVLVKSNWIPDHLERISLAAVRPIECKRIRCRRRVFCDDCRLLAPGRRRSRWNGSAA